MISQVHIKNFKSIVDLTLDLGRVNLFIGENGSGKSNILEAIAFVSAGTHIDVSGNALLAKGVRISKPELYCSAFDPKVNDIDIDFIIDGHSIHAQYNLSENWHDEYPRRFSQRYRIFLTEFGKYINADAQDFNLSTIVIRPETPQAIKQAITEEALLIDNYNKYRSSSDLTNFLIYSPEITYLRKFEEEGQISPLGAKGEGLFSLIKSLSKDNGSLRHIKEHLEVIDWFEDFVIPGDLMSNEYKISIKDRFINSDLKYLDQRSANEGFLFLLFYIV